MPIEDRRKQERWYDYAYDSVATEAMGAVRRRGLPAIGLEAEFAVDVEVFGHERPFPVEMTVLVVPSLIG